jgi:hypothetical protein
MGSTRDDGERDRRWSGSVVWMNIEYIRHKHILVIILHI